MKFKNIVFILIVICAFILFNYIKDIELEPRNKIKSFNNGEYSILYSILTDFDKIGGKHIENSYNYYLVKKNNDLALVFYIQRYIEFENRLYLIGVDYYELIEKHKNVDYEYFVLDYSNDKLDKYNSLQEMPEELKTIFEKSNDWTFLR